MLPTPLFRPTVVMKSGVALCEFTFEHKLIPLFNKSHANKCWSYQWEITVCWNIYQSVIELWFDFLNTLPVSEESLFSSEYTYLENKIHQHWKALVWNFWWLKLHSACLRLYREEVVNTDYIWYISDIGQFFFWQDIIWQNSKTNFIHKNSIWQTMH